ncbi:AAA family ATPase [Coraliomargarita akajimensis]|uniref:ATPase associated with various cellular activities AAA_3 n=1 Tax=Coraliomargarita akajimensis (strain DSM 45221 / IAM 15411 / JCM 23193 / KCTC 12865 / 04OKA010-24) TaxID=583355 RepID=D5EQ32_CORAD|nr:MoxR family ATPase [Coraliomargarita akajimensis]ADE53800.1 ATPase associated with various cellular activities AAA_3 [Coraliomargarita akajimensis DSM 45221]
MTQDVLSSETQAALQQATSWIPTLRNEISRVIVGQRYLVDRLLVGMLANGHVLLEGVPGLAKTLSIRTLATATDADFKRIQFTPDLLPADIIGTLIYSPKENTFHTRKGPVFANLVLADEINRAPAKVQSALLEAMQERQVTIGEETFPLPEPFLVLATENPIDQEGTYPLPEAQVDRFMLKLKIGYPTKADEREILDRMASTTPNLEVDAVTTLEAVREARKHVNEVYVDPKIRDYVVDLILATREPEQFNLKLAQYIQFGASPRATISLTLAAKAWALMQGRAYVTPQDIKEIGMDVLRHRVIPSYEAEAEEITSEDLVTSIFEAVPVP